MSEDTVTPVVTPAVAPVAAYEPPYYAAIFTSVRTPGDDGYAETAERMGELVREIPGFLGEDAARTEGGLGITVAYFRDLAGLERWRADAAHRAAKERGRANWYERYTLHIARVEHSRAFERTPGSAPATHGPATHGPATQAPVSHAPDAPAPVRLPSNS
ncbi:antibiotic biosynthesis monooxygenase family protein [Streptomyces sp. NPDC058739]|uniref:antibiotic biosynthesis monooxygenase family protein n=1 Tax=Streptomyces sp. NPDC058739 TaxID=3346618 RepID=UPI00368D8F89